jgi:LuxR family transcriptional regulator, maltose regulon positive regulatory protein
MGLNLADEDISLLEMRTEGWITGLRMAGISMAKHTSPQHFIKAFSGSHRYILDYLTEEVLNQQPAQIRSFLLQTSILDRLNAELCNFVAERDDSDEILRQIEAANLFIEPLDETRKWYRYHSLFTDLLHHHLNQVNLDTVSDLHRRASTWYEQHNMLAQAINHSLSAGLDSKRTASLIEKVAENLLSLGHISTLQNWIQSLPEDVVCNRPLLCVYHALSLLYAGGSLNKIETRLTEAKRNDSDMKFSGAILAIRAYIAMLQGDAHLSVQMSNQALKLLPRESSLLQLHIAGFLGRMHMMNGNVSSAIQSLERVAEISQRTDNVFLNARALNRLAELHIMQGQLHEAQRYYNQIFQMALDSEGRPLPITGIAHMGLGELFREWNDLPSAMHHIEEGIALTRKYSETRVINGYISLARARQATGQSDIASELSQKAMFLAEQYDIDNIKRIYVGQRQVRLWILQNKLELARQWIEEHSPAGFSGSDAADDEGSKIPTYLLVNEFEQITKARFFIATKKPQEALDILSPLLDRVESQNRTGNLIEILILQALARFIHGNTAKALDSLQVALFLAGPAGYVRIFVDEGKPMEDLLKAARATGIEPEYVSTLAKAISDTTSVLPFEIESRTRPSDTFKRLSKREIQVLQFIDTGLSNREIAERLCVTEGTVKRHRYNIYKKLKVEKRSKAVAHTAKELGLI